MAIVVKWLTHLAVNQTFVGSIPIGRPNLEGFGLFFILLKQVILLQS